MRIRPPVRDRRRARGRTDDRNLVPVLRQAGS